MTSKRLFLSIFLDKSHDHTLFSFLSIRGRLGSTSLVVRNTGILIGYILGATINYDYIPIICVILPIVFVIIFAFMLPNTPRYYLHKNQIQVRYSLAASLQ